MEGVTFIFVLISMICACVDAQSDGCPLGCYCKHNFVDCTSLMDFPDALALDTQRIRISHMNIREIPKLAFSYLPNVTLIEIEQCNVGIIAGCAFMDMKSIQKIVFDKTVIGSIESYAFNSLENMKQIEFFKSRIGRLKSFAFYKLSLITTFNMVETNIIYFYSNALYDIRNVSIMLFANNNVSDIVTSAFRDVVVDSFQATSNAFWNMHCGVLDEMYRVSNDADSFSFTSNTFYCNCSVHWMLDTAGRKKYSNILPDYRCHGPDKLNETATLADVNFNDLNCKNKNPDKPLTCEEIKIKIINPTCDPDHRHGEHGHGDESDDGSGAATTLAYAWTHLLLFACVASVYFIRL